jgi:tetratricopeptide (TPR) repeat protein
VVSKRLILALSLSALSAMVAGCATSPAIPPVIASGGAGDSRGDPQQELAVPPSKSATRAVADTGNATLALLKQSDRARSTGNTEEAVAYVERAIRLNPRQADLWVRLAELQLARDDPAAAVQFANKAITLAGQRMDWVRDAWLVIADARAAQGDADAAQEIRARWQTYRG